MLHEYTSLGNWRHQVLDDGCVLIYTTFLCMRFQEWWPWCWAGRLASDMSNLAISSSVPFHIQSFHRKSPLQSGGPPLPLHRKNRPYNAKSCENPAAVKFASFLHHSLIITLLSHPRNCDIRKRAARIYSESESVSSLHSRTWMTFALTPSVEELPTGPSIECTFLCDMKEKCHH